MLSLSKLILLFCSVHLGLAARCGFWDSLVSEARCDSLVKEYKVYVRNEDSEVIHEHAAKLCSNALSCLSSYNCDEINYKRIDLTAHCEISIYASYENEQCLRGFFRKAYASQFSSKQTCFKEFQFVDKDRAEQREAFIEGRTCFFDYLEEYCSSASTDGMDSLTYFQNNYEQFVESMTHEPAVDGCTGPRDLLNVIYCSALSDELDERNALTTLVSFEKIINFGENILGNVVVWSSRIETKRKSNC
uniref:DUF19 domain-containing protein n=1 Tax=Caenorhabditis tropicalis TaxID=1561998 RepID=A0A1I7UW45_9PELO